MSSSQEFPCEFQIPTCYGPRRPEKNGGPIEAEVLLALHDLIARQFNGLTPLGEIKGGAWFDPEEQQIVVEDSLLFQVWVTRDRIPVLREVIASIAKELGQKQMAVVVYNAEVHRISPSDAATGGIVASG